MSGKCCALFDGKLIPGKVLRLESKRCIQVNQGIAGHVPRQPEHQIEIEIIESDASGDFNGAPRVATSVDPAQRF